MGALGFAAFSARFLIFDPLRDCRRVRQLRQWGLAVDNRVVFLGFSLLAALAMAFRATLTSRKSDSHPRLWIIVFSFLTRCLCSITLLGPSGGVGQGGSSVLSMGDFLFLLLYPPACPRLSEEWRPLAAVSPTSPLSTQQPDPVLCLLPAFD